jgi:hypothetical protein
MYVSGSMSYSPDSIEWTYDVERADDGGYLRSQLLANIYRLAYEHPSGLGNTAEYPLVLAYGAMTARLALEQGANKSIDTDVLSAGFAGLLSAGHLQR